MKEVIKQILLIQSIPPTNPLSCKEMTNLILVVFSLEGLVSDFSNDSIGSSSLIAFLESPIPFHFLNNLFMNPTFTSIE